MGHLHYLILLKTVVLYIFQILFSCRLICIPNYNISVWVNILLQISSLLWSVTCSYVDIHYVQDIGSKYMVLLSCDFFLVSEHFRFSLILFLVYVTVHILCKQVRSIYVQDVSFSLFIRAFKSVPIYSYLYPTSFQPDPTMSIYS